MPCVVYWLFDDRCVCPWRHGYIGVSVEFDARLKRHRDRAGTRKSAVGVPSIFDHKILFIGGVDECVALEERMRPQKAIGWNRAQGGRKPWLDYKHDAGTRAKISDAAKRSEHNKLPKSTETRAKQSAAMHRRYADPAWHAAVASHLKTFDHSGSNNGNFGKPHSEAAKQKMREQKVKSVCKQGHPKEPGEKCIECQRRWMREYYHRRKNRRTA